MPMGTNMKVIWIDDQKAGQGVFTWANGDQYEREYLKMSVPNSL